MTSRNVTNKATHIIAEYPKWVDGVLYKNEEAEMESENHADKDRMVKELEAMGKTIDLRSYKGANGYATLKAYYEAVLVREGKDGNSKSDN